MRHQSQNIASFCLVIATIVTAPAVLAQVTLNLQTTQQTSCVATTDVNGLSLVPGTTELQATGVILNGTGCGSNGSGGSDFGTTVTSPANATAGTPFNVQWTASSNATLCTFAGTAGATGWPIGATACTGSQCPGSHTRAITVTNGGQSTFAMTCTNATGFGSAGTTVAGTNLLPPTPANFPLSVPAAVTVGTPFQVSWGVQYATSCTGMAEVNGSSTSLAGWTDSTNASSPRTVTAGQAGVYTLHLTCSNTLGSVTSAPGTTVASSGGGGCPANRQTSMQISTSPSLTNILPVDATQFINIWGRTSTAGGATLTPFPGDNINIYFKDFDKSKYIAAQFTVPFDQSIPIGSMSQAGTTPGPKMTMKLSQTCGDFAADGSLCLFESRGASGRLANWKTPAGTGNACLLTLGATYYVNLKATDPNDSSSYCVGNICKGGVGNNNTPAH